MNLGENSLFSEVNSNFYHYISFTLFSTLFRMYHIPLSQDAGMLYAASLNRSMGNPCGCYRTTLQHNIRKTHGSCTVLHHYPYRQFFNFFYSGNTYRSCRPHKIHLIYLQKQTEKSTSRRRCLISVIYLLFFHQCMV